MIINKIEILKLNWPSLSPDWHPVVVRITTDNGLIGYGEAATSFGIGYEGTIGVIRELAAHYLGKNPLKISELWNSAYQHTFWAQGSGVIFFSAIGAMDIALWDIKGQYENKSIAQLLTTTPKSHLKSYASQIQHGWSKSEQLKIINTSKLQQAALDAINDGYDTIKVEALFEEPLICISQIDKYAQKLAAVRKIIGESPNLIVECHSKLSLEMATLLCQEIQDLNIAYLEEPLIPQDVDAYDQLAQSTNIPIAAGERLANYLQFKPFINNKSLKIIQPDLGACGGITEALRINSLAKEKRAMLQLHTCGGPIATAAALQFEAAMDNFLIHEEHEINLKSDYRNSEHNHYAPINGYYNVPTKPGIGQTLSIDALRNADRIEITKENTLPDLMY